MTGQALWNDWMAFGLGHLRLSSSDFWSMTPRELFAALDGYKQKSGVLEKEPMTKQDLRDLEAECEAFQAARSAAAK